MDYWVIIRTFIGQPNNYTEYNYFQAILYTILLCTIILHVFFSSKLAVLVIKPTYPNKIETLDQLAKSNLKWYSASNGVASAIEFETHEPYKTLYRNFREISNDQLPTLKGNEYAYVIDVSRYYFYTVNPYFTLERLQNFQIMRETLSYQYISLYFRRNSVLVPSINKFVSRCLATGLIKYWDLEANVVADDAARQNYLSQTKEVDEFIDLNVAQISGILIIWFIGLCLSSVVFIIEILTKIKLLKIDSKHGTNENLLHKY
ncbi:uncharacterized protein [Atheta coriaria]|uniref:uncharacterized protein n=1 Tax=Dalotia coriaria TaxID=877792 RepID=UPI0031F3EA4D